MFVLWGAKTVFTPHWCQQLRAKSYKNPLMGWEDTLLTEVREERPRGKVSGPPLAGEFSRRTATEAGCTCIPGSRPSTAFRLAFHRVTLSLGCPLESRGRLHKYWWLGLTWWFWCNRVGAGHRLSFRKADASCSSCGETSLLLCSLWVLGSPLEVTYAFFKKKIGICLQYTIHWCIYTSYLRPSFLSIPFLG